MLDALRLLFDFVTLNWAGDTFAQIYIGLEDSRFFTVGKLTGGLLTLISLIGLLIVSRKKNKINADHAASIESIIMPPASAGEGMLASRWRQIEGNINSEREAEWKLAVIEADKIVDDILKASGFPGDTMGERLTNIQPGQLATHQDIWEAHKIRNRLVHDANYFLRYGEAKRAVDLYKKALVEFGVLE